MLRKKIIAGNGMTKEVSNVFLFVNIYIYIYIIAIFKRGEKTSHQKL